MLLKWSCPAFQLPISIHLHRKNTSTLYHQSLQANQSISHSHRSSENHWSSLRRSAAKIPKLSTYHNRSAASRPWAHLVDVVRLRNYDTSTHLADNCEFIVCTEFVTLWLMPCAYSNTEFCKFFKSGHIAGHILAIHTLLLDYILGKFCFPIEHCPKTDIRKRTVIGWTRHLASSLSADDRVYMRWPLLYCEQLIAQDARYMFSPWGGNGSHVVNKRNLIRRFFVYGDGFGSDSRGSDGDLCQAFAPVSGVHRPLHGIEVVAFRICGLVYF